MAHHADALALPSSITTKAAFYEHVNEQLEHLLAPEDDGKQHWISAFANASALLFGSFENAELGGKGWGREPGKRVNWTGFYITPSTLSASSSSSSSPPTKLFLGPFQGRPACLSVSLVPLSPSRPVGVCAAAYLSKETQVVPDVELRPGHVACDGLTRAEIVIPVRGVGGEVVGVLDLDAEQENAFGEEDRVGLERFVKTLEGLVDWGR